MAEPVVFEVQSVAVEVARSGCSFEILPPLLQFPGCASREVMFLADKNNIKEARARVELVSYCPVSGLHSEHMSSTILAGHPFSGNEASRQQPGREQLGFH